MEQNLKFDFKHPSDVEHSYMNYNSSSNALHKDSNVNMSEEAMT